MTLFEKITFLKPVISNILRLMTHRHKILLGLMLLLIIGFSLVETIGISAIMPFISIVSDTTLLESGWYKKAFDFFGFASAENFIITIGIGIIIFYLFRAVYSVALTYFLNRYSFGIYKYLSKKIFKINLSVSYRLFSQKNSAEMMQAIINETHESSNAVLHVLQLCSEIFTVLMVYTVIIILNWKMTLVLTAVLSFMIFFLLSSLTKISSIQGKKKFTSGRKMNRILKETLSNLKYVKLKGNEEDILRNYEKTIDVNTRSELISNVVGIIPKGIFESLGFSLLIAVVVFIVWRYHDASKVIPVISMYALALYRILPSLHRMLNDINRITYREKIIENVEEQIRQPVEKEGSSPLEFNKCVRLENINFKYLTGSEVITDISFKINKGEKIAITGESGGGKSTLVDIIIGIHRPISGKVFIDDTLLTDENIRSWRKKIGYIPQSIYLFDGTVAENVAFGSISDEEKIKTALVKANIWDFLAQKEGINTLVGDGGIQLSGGQQQRIGIARALYDDPEVLVLDEATSSLDNETEQKIMDEIYSVSAHKTLIVIAHRLSTVERCDRRIRIAAGRIIYKDS
jgi:ATP-binding cassette subfamily B protein/ATP-binding cassette subfamily C protein